MLEVADRKAAPGLREIVEDEAAVTVVGVQFAAEQNCGLAETRAVEAILNLALFH